jgi:hypothetical protein
MLAFTWDRRGTTSHKILGKSEAEEWEDMEHIIIYRISWDLNGFDGFLRDFVGFDEILWDLMGFHVILQDLMVFHGIL